MTSGPLNHLPADALARFGLTPLRRNRTTADLRLPKNVAAFLRHDILAGRHDGALIGALFVNRRVQPVGYSLPYLGYLADADVEPRKLLGPGLVAGAAALFLFQQRPSGGLEADGQDLAVSESIRVAGELMQVRLLDHFLLGPNGEWSSLRESGQLKRLHEPGEAVNLPYLSAAAAKIDRRRHVKPKYANPADPRLTWSGRGRMAAWLREAIEGGARIEDFLVEE